MNNSGAVPSSVTASPNWFGWALATTIGCSVGTSVSTYVTAMVAPTLSQVLGGMLSILVYGAIIGLVLAGMQYLALGAGHIVRWPWLIATAAGASVGYALAALAGEMLGNIISPTVNVVVSEGTIEGISGAIVGLAIGGAQWHLIRTALPRRPAWMIASAIGGALGYSLAAAALELLEVPFLKAHAVLSYGAILGVFLGTAQGSVLWAGRGEGSR